MGGFDAVDLAVSRTAGQRRWFGTDGVRGVVGDTLTPELVELPGRAPTTA